MENHIHGTKREHFDVLISLEVKLPPHRTIKITKEKKKRQGLPIELLKAETAGVVIVNLVNCVLDDLPCTFGVLGIYLDPVLVRLDLKDLLL
jgi:hypothetical protein